MEDSIVMRRLMLIVLALGLASGQDSKMKYLLTAPAVMPYPSNQTVCVYVMLPDSNTKIVTSLTAKSGTSSFNTEIGDGDGQLYCNTFEIPPPMNGEEEVATVTVDITSDVQKQSMSKDVIIRPIRTEIFVQTDRAIYQPGDKVFIRAVDFNEHLIANNEKFTDVTIQDDQGNILKQWQNPEPKSGILDLSFNISPNIRVGDLKITVTKNNLVADTTIAVDKFVLPKFEVEIEAPAETTIHQTTFPISICCKYTYGKPVRGQLIGKICRYAIFSPDHICKAIDGKTDVYGCYTTDVDTDYFKYKHDSYNNNVYVEVSLIEDGTGVERKARKNIFITDVLAKVEFKVSRGVYKPGVDYRGSMTLTGSDGLPLADEDIELYVDEERREEVYTTDNVGMARFTLESAIFTNEVMNLRARFLPRQPEADPTDPSEVQPVYNDGHASLIPSYANTISQVKIRNDPFLLPCNEKVNLWADYVLDPSEFSKETIEFHYMVITFGRIVFSSSIRHTTSTIGGPKSFFPFPIMINSDMSPAATIIIYAGLENGELIADSVKIPVISCFPNKVSLKFSDEDSLPGSMGNLHISAYPNSLCSVRSVDKSVELLKAEEKRSEDVVNEYLNQWDTVGYPIQIEELQQCPSGSSPVFVDSSDRPDIFTGFEDCGMKTVTNFVIRKPPNCYVAKATDALGVEDHLFLVQNSAAHIVAEPEPTLPPQEDVRKKFPSTWLMNLVPIGPSGELDYPIETADTITQWKTDAFCTSAIGLGFSPQTFLQVFKPFFLEMIIPYSVKQGEAVVLKAIVLNFMRRCIKVQATLYESSDFLVEPCVDCTYTACLCSEPTYTFTWNIRPLTMGAINIIIGTKALSTSELCDGQTPIVPTKGQSDIVQRRLIVEPNGVPVEKTSNFLICAFQSQTISLDLPENVVLGSQSAEVTVTGNIMGKPLQNLNALVNLPTGCGEQNMIHLAPTIAVMGYYSATGQLTDEIVNKANEYMEEGYQNQLNYKHDDGSYSAFGNSDVSGSTWLTALVARFFFLGTKYIFIEYRHITEALDWLKGQQQSNGCFKNVGRVIHQELQGGLDSETSLTAYVTSAFLEIGDPQYDDVVEKAKQCLENCTQAQSSTYTKAQCAYTYTLLGDTVRRTQLLEQLDKVAIKQDDKTYWSNSEIPEDNPSQAKSGEVEPTAYVLLTLVSGTEPSEKDLGAAVPVVHWLTSQQNANGGFTTTQDTLVALWGISIYAARTFVDENMPNITITNDKGFSDNVIVDSKKPTEVQTVDLPDIPAEYTLEASGSGCAYVQVILRYNILNPEPDRTFILDVTSAPIECPPHPTPSFTIDISVGLSDTSENKASNMAIMIVKMVSGFVPIEDSVNRLLANSLVMRVESSQTEVTIYLDKVESTQNQLSIEVEQQSEVKDLNAAVVYLKDYYETSRHIEVSYEYPCK